MSTQVTAYRTIDGELFLTEKEANRHELYLELLGKIENFLASPENTLKNKIPDDVASVFIASWEQYRRTH